MRNPIKLDMKLEIGGVSPTSRKNNKLGLTTVEGDLVGKKPTV